MSSTRTDLRIGQVTVALDELNKIISDGRKSGMTHLELRAVYFQRDQLRLACACFVRGDEKQGVQHMLSACAGFCLLQD